MAQWIWSSFLKKKWKLNKNGRSRGCAVLVLAVLGSRAASTRTAQPLDLPFLVWFPIFLHNCTPYMLGHLPLSVNYKLKNCHHSTIYWMFEIIVLLKISFWSESFSHAPSCNTKYIPNTAIPFNLINLHISCWVLCLSQFTRVNKFTKSHKKQYLCSL